MVCVPIHMCDGFTILGHVMHIGMLYNYLKCQTTYTCVWVADGTCCVHTGYVCCIEPDG